MLPDDGPRRFLQVRNVGVVQDYPVHEQQLPLMVALALGFTAQQLKLGRVAGQRHDQVIQGLRARWLQGREDGGRAIAFGVDPHRAATQAV